jgi:hypothetical protein
MSESLTTKSAHAKKTSLIDLATTDLRCPSDTDSSLAIDQSSLRDPLLGTVHSLERLTSWPTGPRLTATKDAALRGKQDSSKETGLVVSVLRAASVRFVN